MPAGPSPIDLAAQRHRDESWYLFLGSRSIGSFAFAMQCTSTLAIVRRERNNWRWPAVRFAFMNVGPYLSAFADYRFFCLG
jgi:hypothetical protein